MRRSEERDETSRHPAPFLPGDVAHPSVQVRSARVQGTFLSLNKGPKAICIALVAVYGRQGSIVLVVNLLLCLPLSQVRVRREERSMCKGRGAGLQPCNVRNRGPCGWVFSGPPLYSIHRCPGT